MSDLKHHKGGAAKTSNSSEKDGFKPINLSSLESFNAEVSGKTPETQPDFNRFKLLFDPAELEQTDVSFEALYSFAKNEDEPFEPLIKGAGEDPEPESPKKAKPEPEAEEPEDTEPEKTPEEIGFETGFEKGLAQGRATGQAEGEAKGFEQGLAAGQAEGMKKGEAEGFAKGEAEGIEKGYQEGRETAQAEVVEEAAQILEPLRKGIETIDRLMDRLVKRYELQIIELVQKIAEKAVMARVEVDDEVVKHTILDALKSLVAPEEISLSVCAEDYEYVEMIKDEFFESVRSIKSVAVSSDPMIKKGGCRIETATATIATDPEVKLAAVYDAIVKAARP